VLSHRVLGSLAGGKLGLAQVTEVARKSYGFTCVDTRTTLGLTEKNIPENSDVQFH